MDSKLISTKENRQDLVERYVLQQLNDDELALFRGQMMFDERLRQEVIQTKALLGAIQTVALGQQPAKTALPLASTGISIRKVLVGVGVGLAILAAGSVYYLNSSQTDRTEKQNNIPAIDDINNVKSNVPEVKTSEPVNNANTIDQNNTTQENTSSPTQTIEPQTPVAKDSTTTPDEEIIFAAASPSKKVITDFDEEMAFAESPSMASNETNKNEYLEDVISSSETKSETIIANVKLNDISNLSKNKNGAVYVNCTGNILNGKSKTFIFKIFTNNTQEYLDSMPKYQEHFQTLPNAPKAFDLKVKIDLPVGLYYYVIEEEGEFGNDMIFAGKFLVQKSNK